VGDEESTHISEIMTGLILFKRVSGRCPRSVTYVRIRSDEIIVSSSLQSARSEDTVAREGCPVEYIATARERAAPERLMRSSWTLGMKRLLGTARELLACRLEVLAARRRGSSNAGQRAALLQRVSARMGARMGLQARVSGPVPSGACLLVANHMGYLDPVAIGAVLPLSAIAKSEVTQWPAVGEALEELGVVFVERGSAMSGALALRKAMRVLQAGVPVLVFPEGTTTFGEDVLPFSRGAFGIARMLRVPVVPVTIRYETRLACWVGSATFIPHLIRLHKRGSVNAEVIFGPPIEPMAFPDASSLAAATRLCIRSLVLP
jgi:1-acyl-sn-glycerol-3-phosphate acyltransferase